MKKISTFSIISVVSVLILCFWAGDSCRSQNPCFQDTLSLSIQGKSIIFVCTGIHDNEIHYESMEPYVKNDTLFLKSYLDYWRDNADDEFKCDTSFYYVISHTGKDFDKSINAVNYRYSRVKAGDEEYLAMLLEARNNLISEFPDLKSNRLGNMPRKWYQLEKYGDSYYYSIDSYGIMEFYDNMVLFYGMELWYEALTDFKRLPDGGWEYTLKPSRGSSTKVTVKPSSRLKGTYIMTKLSNGSHSSMSLWTSDKDIKRFDIIEWDSSFCEEYGLQYDKIDFESIK